VNRVDMGTADKVCAAALAVAHQAERGSRPIAQVSLVLLELGGAFTAVIAVGGGKIVDGVGGSSGPLGFRAAGALDGEVAFLAGSVSKAMLFTGGAAAIAGWDDAGASPERFGTPATPPEGVAWDAFVESVAKYAAALALSVPSPTEFVLSGRLAQVGAVQGGVCPRGEDSGAGGRAHRGRPRGRRASGARRDDGDSGRPRHRARPLVRDLPPTGPATAGALLMLPRVLIVGVSTRGLAESAARAGYRVVAVDSFGDLDLRACADAVSIARTGGENRFSVRAALHAVRAVPCDVATYVASFENHPDAVRALARRAPLWGNPPAVLRRVRDPRSV